LIHSEFKIKPCQKWQGFFCTYILGSFSAFHSRFFAIAKDVFPSVEISVIRNGKKSSVQVGLQIQPSITFGLSFQITLTLNIKSKTPNSQ